MATIDAYGRLPPSHGDVLGVYHYFHAKDYGKYDLTPEAPSIGIHHVTDSALDYGEDNSNIAALTKRVIGMIRAGAPTAPNSTPAVTPASVRLSDSPAPPWAPKATSSSGAKTSGQQPRAPD